MGTNTFIDEHFKKTLEEAENMADNYYDIDMARIEFKKALILDLNNYLLSLLKKR